MYGTTERREGRLPEAADWFACAIRGAGSRGDAETFERHRQAAAE